MAVILIYFQNSFLNVKFNSLVLFVSSSIGCDRVHQIMICAVFGSLLLCRKFVPQDPFICTIAITYSQLQCQSLSMPWSALHCCPASSQLVHPPRLGCGLNRNQTTVLSFD